MGKRERALFRAVLVLFCVVAVATVGAVFASRAGQSLLAMCLGVISALAWVAAIVSSKLYDRTTRDRAGRMPRIVRQIQLVPTRADERAWLDRERLSALTSDLEPLGFSALGDYAVGCGGEPVEDIELPESFTRVLADEKRRVFAEVGQSVRAGAEPTEMICTFTTFFSSGDQCRTIGGKQAAAGLQLLPLQQLQLTVFAEPDVTVEELLKRHLDQRAKLAEEHDLAIVEDTSIETYRQQVDEMHRRMCAWASRLMHGIGSGVL